MGTKGPPCPGTPQGPAWHQLAMEVDAADSNLLHRQPIRRTSSVFEQLLYFLFFFFKHLKLYCWNSKLHKDTF